MVTKLDPKNAICFLIDHLKSGGILNRKFLAHHRPIFNNGCHFENQKQIWSKNTQNEKVSKWLTEVVPSIRETLRVSWRTWIFKIFLQIALPLFETMSSEVESNSEELSFMTILPKLQEIGWDKDALLEDTYHDESLDSNQSSYLKMSCTTTSNNSFTNLLEKFDLRAPE